MVNAKKKNNGRRATVVDFPARGAILRHIDALQVLALQRPRLAKAVLKLTDKLARACRPRAG